MKVKLGEIDGGIRDFTLALEKQKLDENKDCLYSLRGTYHTLLLTRLGRHEEAQKLTEANKHISSNGWGDSNKDIPGCNLILADVALSSNVGSARTFYTSAQNWALARDAKEMLCWSALIQARIELTDFRKQEIAGVQEGLSVLSTGQEALTEGLKIARDCGYGIYHIDLLLEQASLHLLQGNSQDALAALRLALDDGIPPNDATGQTQLLAATDPECGYAWGIVEGLHRRGKALLLQASQFLGADAFIPAKRDSLPAEVQALISQAEACLTEAMGHWRNLRDPEVNESNFIHPETDEEHNYRAAETYRVLSDLKGGLLTRYPLNPAAVVPELQPSFPTTDNMKNFFISYNGQDEQWATWIAQILENAGYTTVIQAWDFRAGGDFVMEMQKAAMGTEKTIAVLSDNYLNADFTHPEWTNAFARDPQGNNRTLIPVRIAKCKPPGLLATRIYIDLVSLAADEAAQTLLDGLEPDGRPTTPVAFPGPSTSNAPTATPAAPVSSPQPQSFPGQPSAAVAVWQEKLEFLRTQEALVSDPAQKFTLQKQLEEAEQKIRQLS